MNDVITNTSVIQNPEIDNVRIVLKDYIKNHHYRFIQFNIICRWELCFSDNSTLSPISSITIFSDTSFNIITNKVFTKFFSNINYAKKKIKTKFHTRNENCFQVIIS